MFSAIKMISFVCTLEGISQFLFLSKKKCPKIPLHSLLCRNEKVVHAQNFIHTFRRQFLFYADWLFIDKRADIADSSFLIRPIKSIDSIFKFNQKFVFPNFLEFTTSWIIQTIFYVTVYYTYMSLNLTKEWFKLVQLYALWRWNVFSFI